MTAQTIAASPAPWELTAREEAAADERWWTDRYDREYDTEPDDEA